MLKLYQEVTHQLYYELSRVLWQSIVFVHKNGLLHKQTTWNNTKSKYWQKNLPSCHNNSWWNNNNNNNNNKSNNKRQLEENDVDDDEEEYENNEDERKLPAKQHNNNEEEDEDDNDDDDKVDIDIINNNPRHSLPNCTHNCLDDVETPPESKRKYHSLGVFSLEKGVWRYYIVCIVSAIKSTQNINKEKVVAN